MSEHIIAFGELIGVYKKNKERKMKALLFIMVSTKDNFDIFLPTG